MSVELRREGSRERRRKLKSWDRVDESGIDRYVSKKTNGCYLSRRA